MNKSLFFLYFKILLSIFSLFFILNYSKEHYQYFFKNINFDLFWLTVILFIRIFIQNLLSLRIFAYLKSTSNYDRRFRSWSYLYFYTGLVNLSPLWGSGHLVRSYEMKLNKYSHQEYVSMQYNLYFWGMLLNSFFLLLLYFNTNDQNTYVVLSLLTLFLISIITFSKKLVYFIHQLITRLGSITFFSKIKLIKYIIGKISQLTLISSKNLTANNFFNFSTITIFLFIFEYLKFVLVFKFLFNTIDWNIITIFYVISYLIKKTPMLDGLIGVREVLLGLYSNYFGLLFIEGAIFALTIRFINYAALLTNISIYFLFKRFSRKIF